MIEIIIEEVKMPPTLERRYQYGIIGKKWIVTDSTDNAIRYKGGYEEAAIALS